MPQSFLSTLLGGANNWRFQNFPRRPVALACCAQLLISAQQRLLRRVHELFSNVNPCDARMNNWIARWLEAIKPGCCQRISYRNQPAKVRMDKRLARVTAITHRCGRAERESRKRENLSQHANNHHAAIVVQKHRDCQWQSADAWRPVVDRA